MAELNTAGLPPLPEGFTLDVVPKSKPVSADLPPLPEGFTLDAPAGAKQPSGILGSETAPLDLVGTVKSARDAGTINPISNTEKGIAENVVKLEGSAVRGLSTLPNVPGMIDKAIYSALGQPAPANYPQDEEVQKVAQETAKQLENVDLGFKPGDSWEDVKKAPASKFLPWAVQQGFLSAPDMAVAMASLPGYALVRSGSMGQQRAQNDERTNATVEDVLKVLPAAAVSGLLDKFGAHKMFGIDEIAAQGLKDVLKETGKAAVTEGGTEAAQQVVEDIGTNAGTKKGFDVAQTLENAGQAGLAGSVFGGAVRGVTSTSEAKRGKTVEPGVDSSQEPVSQAGEDGVNSPSPSSSPASISAMERAVLRKISTPDEDIDRMSRPEIDALLKQARDARIKVSKEEQDAAGQYAPVSADMLAAASADLNTPEASPATSETAKSASQKMLNDYAVRKQREADMTAAADQRVTEIQPALSAEVMRSVYEGGDKKTLDRPAPADLAVPPAVTAKRMLGDLRARDEQQRTAEAAKNTQADAAVEAVSPDLERATRRSLVEPAGTESMRGPSTAVEPTNRDVARGKLQQLASRDQQANDAVAAVESDLQNVVSENVATNNAEEANIARNLDLPLAARVQRSIYEDTPRSNGDGSRTAPVRVEQPADIEIAAQRVNTEPSEAQQVAGNYQKGHVKVSGVDVTIETPKGAMRTGTTPDGKQWKVKLPAHYGYVKRSTGADGDQVDVYVGPNPQSKRVYVIDQKDIRTGRFDEHKAILGANSVTEARALYAKAFSDEMGNDRVGGIKPMSTSEFKKWIATGETTKPVAMGKPSVRTNDQGFPVDTKGIVKKPDSLIEFLARKGGVRDETGELKSFDLGQRKTGFVAGAGPVLRPNGLHPDKAREAAAEAGYLPMESSVADFYDAIDRDIRSNRESFSQYDDDWSTAWRDQRGNTEADQTANLQTDQRKSPENQGRDDVFTALVGDDIAGKHGDEFSKRVWQIMQDGNPYENAVELAHIEARDDLASVHPEVAAIDIPFFEASNEVHPQTTSSGSTTDQRSRSQDARRSEVESRTRRVGEAGSGDSTPERKEPEQKYADGPQQAPQRVSPPATVYHGTSNGGFDTFDTYAGEYGLFGSGGYFTEDPNIALEYTRKGKGIAPTVYSAKLNLKNPLDMDAKADTAAWAKAFPDYFSKSDLSYMDKDPTNEQVYREVEENLSQEMIPSWEGAETMQGGVMSMGHDAITHIGGGRHKDSKGTKHRVWIVFDPEQVSNFKADAATSDVGADSKPQLVIPGAERASDKTMTQRAADSPMRSKAPQKDAGGLFSDEMDQKDLLDLSINPEPAKPSRLSDEGRKHVADIVRRVANLDTQFVEKIDAPDGRTAAGSYSPAKAAITIALDSGTNSTAFHEAFHHLQNLFLDTREKALLHFNEPLLRQMIAQDGKFDERTVENMSLKEVEAEAFSIWSTSPDRARVHVGIRRVWNQIKQIADRVRNYLNGRGYQTLDDVFGKAESGETAKRETASNDHVTDDAQFALNPQTVARAPNHPQSIGVRISRSLKMSKAVANRAKQMGSKYDKITTDDGETTNAYFHRKFIDYLDPLKRLQDSVGGALNDMMNPYLTARLSEGTTRYEIQQIDDKYVTPAVRELAGSGASLEDLHKLMYAVHVPERNRVVGLRNEAGTQLHNAATDPSVVGASGMSVNEARRIVRDFQQDPEKYRALQRAAAHVRAMLDESLRRQLRAGLISQASYDELTKQWKNYVPLHAEADTDGEGSSMPSKSRGFDVRGDEHKAATGRYSEADNVIVYAINQAEQSIIREEKNKVGAAALRFVNQFDPKGTNDIAEVYWSDDPDKIMNTDKAAAVYKRELDKDGKVVSRKTSNFQMMDDVVATKIGGKTYYIRFKDPKVGLAIKKMTFAELGVVLGMIRKVSNWQSLINTRANPAFILTNLARDVQTAGMLSLAKDFSVKEAAKIMTSVPKSWGALWNHTRGNPGNGAWDQTVKQFMQAGGKINFDQYNDIEGTMKKLEKDMRINTATGVPLNPLNSKTLRTVTKFVMDLNDILENGTRVSIFKAALDRGETPAKAAFMARDLTVDFQKKGENTPVANSLYTFFNASVQGSYNFAKALRDSRKVKIAAAAMMGGGIAQTLWNLAFAGDDDDGQNAYEKMLQNEPWKLERNMVFFIPGTTRYHTIPMGYGINAFWHLGVQGAAVTAGKQDVLPAMLSSGRVAIDAFNPLGSGSLLNMAMPTIADPFIDIQTNTNFAGNPIYPSVNAFDKAPPPDSQQSFKNTAPAFKWMAETMNAATFGNKIEPGYADFHPDTLEHWWGFFTGGMGRFVSQTAESAWRGANLEFEPTKTPFVRSFYGEMDENMTRAEYYDRREKVQYVKGHLKDYQDAGNEEDINRFMEDHQKDVRAIGVYDAAEKQRKAINKQRRRIDASEMPQGKKDDQLKALDDREMQIMRDTGKRYYQITKD